MVFAAVHAPTIADMLTVCSAGGTVLGGIVGFLLKAESDRRIAENLVLGGGVGLFAGFLLGFVIYVAAKAAGA
jgi:hypothetical protein